MSNVMDKFQAMLIHSKQGKKFRDELTEMALPNNSSAGRKALGSLLIEQPILSNSMMTGTGTIKCTLNYYDGCTPDFDF